MNSWRGFWRLFGFYKPTPVVAQQQSVLATKKAIFPISHAPIRRDRPEKKHYVASPVQHQHEKKGIDVESAAFGAIVGAALSHHSESSSSSSDYGSSSSSSNDSGSFSSGGGDFGGGGSSDSF